jgi:uncharacterized membrane protein HdeD (DUF308 family)
MEHVTDLLSRYWWLLLIRGVLAVLFGVAAFAWPGMTLAMLILIFAMFAFSDGVLEVVHALSHRKEIEHWILMLLEGLLGIAVGLVTFFAPLAALAAGAIILAMYMAVWAIVTGALRIVMAVRLRKEIDGEWLLGLSGAVSILFGIAILAMPALGALAAVFLVGAWAIVLGITLIMLALKARKFGTHVKDTVAAAAT